MSAGSLVDLTLISKLFQMQNIDGRLIVYWS